MSGPRDAGMKWGIPINLATGLPYTDAQLSRIDRLTAAAALLSGVMHECEGSDEGNAQFSTRLMSIAGTHLETALLFAIKGASEVK